MSRRKKTIDFCKSNISEASLCMRRNLKESIKKKFNETKNFKNSGTVGTGGRLKIIFRLIENTIITDAKSTTEKLFSQAEEKRIKIKKGDMPKIKELLKEQYNENIIKSYTNFEKNNVYNLITQCALAQNQFEQRKTCCRQKIDCEIDRIINSKIKLFKIMRPSHAEVANRIAKWSLGISILAIIFSVIAFIISSYSN